VTKDNEMTDPASIVRLYERETAAKTKNQGRVQ
jgi:hypothetical protein